MTNKEMLQELIKGVGSINQRLDSIESRVNKLENPEKPFVSKKGTKKVSEKDTRTWSEKKAEWASKNFTEAERKAYGEAKRAEREKQHKAYEMTNKCFTERVSKSVWTAKYKEILATL